MGYYTCHALTWDPHSSATDDLIAEWIENNEDPNLALNVDGSTNESIKWYEAEG